MIKSTYDLRAEEILRKYNECKEKKARLEERYKMTMEDIHDKFHCDSLEELDALKQKLEKDVEKLDKRIEPMLDKLEESLDL